MCVTCICMKYELRDQRVPVVMTLSDKEAIDTWRRQQADMPSRNDAILRLCALGLAGGQSRARTLALLGQPQNPETRQNP